MSGSIDGMNSLLRIKTLLKIKTEAEQVPTMPQSGKRKVGPVSLRQVASFETTHIILSILV